MNQLTERNVPDEPQKNDLGCPVALAAESDKRTPHSGLDDLYRRTLDIS